MKKTHLHHTNALKTNEQRLKRKDVRFLQDLFSWTDTNATQMVHLRCWRSSLKAVLRSS